MHQGQADTLHRRAQTRRRRKRRQGMPLYQQRTSLGLLSSTSPTHSCSHHTLFHIIQVDMCQRLYKQTVVFIITLVYFVHYNTLLAKVTSQLHSAPSLVAAMLHLLNVCLPARCASAYECVHRLRMRSSASGDYLHCPEHKKRGQLWCVIPKHMLHIIRGCCKGLEHSLRQCTSILSAIHIASTCQKAEPTIH